MRRSETAATVAAIRMPYRALFLLTLLVLALNARAAWVEKESRVEASPVAGLTHQHLVLEDSENGASATLDLARFSSKSCRLRLIDNPSGRSLAETAAAAGCLAGVNGGYFDENFAPLGWRVIDGKVIAPLRRARLFNGAIIATGGSIQIARNSEVEKFRKPTMALQCGPFLVDHAQRLAGLDDTRAARRTFAAVGAADQAALGLCSDISLADLSALLARGIGNLKIQRALNLDGGSSSGFWFKRKDGNVFSVPPQKSVRDFLVIER
jgi:Phosphodiester glycosidase